MVAVPLAAIESLSKFTQRSPASGVGDLRAVVESLASNASPLLRTRSKELLIRLGAAKQTE